jgi:hypothetical protein
MNYEKKAPDWVHDIFKKKNIQYYDLSYFAWPQVFGSTTGPNGGIGGQAMSSFTIEAFVANENGPTVYACSNQYCFEDKQFVPFARIYDWSPIP